MFIGSSSGFSVSLASAAPSTIALTVFVVFLQATILYGGEEELGWRGTLQPLLQKKMPFIPATLIVGVIWVIWHIPLWFIEGDSHQSMPFYSFAIMGVLLSFWLAALYNVSDSIILCLVLHGLTNTLMGVCLITSDVAYGIGLALLTLASIVGGIIASKLRSVSQPSPQ